jgi:hypothetical protein
LLTEYERAYEKRYLKVLPRAYARRCVKATECATAYGKRYEKVSPRQYEKVSPRQYEKVSPRQCWTGYETRCARALQTERSPEA